MLNKETICKETNERLLYLLETLAVQKNQDYRHDGVYQKDIDIVKAEIIRRITEK